MNAFNRSLIDFFFKITRHLRRLADVADSPADAEALIGVDLFYEICNAMTTTSMAFPIARSCFLPIASLLGELFVANNPGIFQTQVGFM